LGKGCRKKEGEENKRDGRNNAPGGLDVLVKGELGPDVSEEGINLGETCHGKGAKRGELINPESKNKL